MVRNHKLSVEIEKNDNHGRILLHDRDWTSDFKESLIPWYWCKGGKEKEKKE